MEMCGRYIVAQISIHVPRVEDDKQQLKSKNVYIVISIHVPRVEDDVSC